MSRRVGGGRACQPPRGAGQRPLGSAGGRGDAGRAEGPAPPQAAVSGLSGGRPLGERGWGPVGGPGPQPTVA